MFPLKMVIFHSFCMFTRPGSHWVSPILSMRSSHDPHGNPTIPWASYNGFPDLGNLQIQGKKTRWVKYMVQFNSETRVGINGIKWDMTKNNDNNVQIMAFCGYNIGMCIYIYTWWDRIKNTPWICPEFWDILGYITKNKRYIEPWLNNQTSMKS